MSQVPLPTESSALLLQNAEGFPMIFANRIFGHLFYSICCDCDGRNGNIPHALPARLLLKGIELRGGHPVENYIHGAERRRGNCG